MQNKTEFQKKLKELDKMAESTKMKRWKKSNCKQTQGHWHWIFAKKNKQTSMKMIASGFVCVEIKWPHMQLLSNPVVFHLTLKRIWRQ